MDKESDGEIEVEDGLDGLPKLVYQLFNHCCRGSPMHNPFPWQHRFYRLSNVEVRI